MEKQVQDLLTKEAKAREALEMRVAKLENSAQLSSDSSKATEALLKENEGNLALLKESQDKVGELEEKLARAESRTMGDFTPTEKAEFVIAWGKGLSPEEKAVFCEAVGIPMSKATDAEVALAEGEPKIIQGKTDKEGYKFLEHLNLSIREE